MAHLVHPWQSKQYSQKLPILIFLKLCFLGHPLLQRLYKGHSTKSLLTIPLNQKFFLLQKYVTTIFLQGVPKKCSFVKIEIGNFVFITMSEANKLQQMYNYLEKLKVSAFSTWFSCKEKEKLTCLIYVVLSGIRGDKPDCVCVCDWGRYSRGQWFFIFFDFSSSPPIFLIIWMKKNFMQNFFEKKLRLRGATGHSNLENCPKSAKSGISLAYIEEFL